jgi:hypothetical protein
MQDSKYYVYLHRLEQTGEIFYVGKGHDRRAWEKTDRNIYWKLKTQKQSYEVLIHTENLTEEQAYVLEKKLIAKYKNIYNGGSLVNLTEGGEGRTGFSWQGQRQGSNNPMYGKTQSEKTRQKIADSKIGKPRPAHAIEASRKYNQNRPKEEHGMYGKNHTIKTREKMKAAAKLRMYTLIINTQTGIFYNSWAEVGTILGLKRYQVEHLRKNNRLTNFQII